MRPLGRLAPALSAPAGGRDMCAGRRPGHTDVCAQCQLNQPGASGVQCVQSRPCPAGEPREPTSSCCIHLPARCFLSDSGCTRDGALHPGLGGFGFFLVVGRHDSVMVPSTGQLGLESRFWDFPGGPVIKTLRFHCRGRGFDPRLGY